MDKKELKQRIMDELGYKIVQLPDSKLWYVYIPDTMTFNYHPTEEAARDWIPNWPKNSDLALALPIPDGWKWEIHCQRTTGHAFQMSRYDVYLWNPKEDTEEPVAYSENKEDLPEEICLLWLHIYKALKRNQHYLKRGSK